MDIRGSRVLVVEDDPGLADGIRENLRLEGYDTWLATDGRSALDVALQEDLDLIVLDVMLPALDGFEVCSKLRRAGRDVPVLFLSARSDPSDRIRGLEAGGDDYLPKPFHLKELLLRVAAIIRRRRGSGPVDAVDGDGRVEFAENEINLQTYRGRSWDGREHELTQREAMILKTLLEREGEVVSREELLDKVWGYDVFPSSRTLEAFIGRLRKRFEREADRPAHFHTEPGVGWRFTRHPEVQ
jgi:two-component system alkaline phosphatase synthesis response regulator PhoP